MYSLLSHLALALAGICLAWAEWPYIPEMMLGLAVYLLLIALAWRIGRRWVLPNWAANVLGLLIAAGASFWVWARLGDPASWAREVELPGALIPYLGPVLMALLVVRLYRPLRLDDFWLLQALGLLQVGLGCVLASDQVFGFLLLVYLVVALCALAGHERETRARACRATAPGANGWLGFGVRWTLAVAALAWPLFLLLPRVEGPDWQPLARFGLHDPKPTTARTGFSPEIDLKRASYLEVDDSVAFVVTATDETGHWRRDLPPNQRWRGLVLDRYDENKHVWSCSLTLPQGQPLFRPSLPGPTGTNIRLQFEVPRKAGSLFLAEPLHLGDRLGELPIQALEGPSGPPAAVPFFFEAGGTAIPYSYLARPEYHYVQILPQDAPRDRYPFVRLREEDLRRMLYHRISGMDVWTVELLNRMAARDATLRPLARALEGPRPRGWSLPPDLWELTARRLADYLAHSGQFTYSLNNTRVATELDPVVDFLVNVRAGSCERYAAALALMLRSLGIPARIVKGYRGAEDRGDGVYEVRQRHAHAWVETVVRAEDGQGYEWLTLDATPGLDAPAAWDWWQMQASGQRMWQNLVIGYNARQQAHLLEDLTTGRLAQVLGPAAVVAGGFLLAVLWRRRRRRQQGGGPAGLYARLQEVLERRLGLRSAPEQTPRELADSAAARLAETPTLAGHADIPGRVIDLLYRCRWGGESAADDETKQLGGRLDELDRALGARS